MNSLDSQDLLCFEGFTIIPGERCLLINDKPVKISSRAFDLLMVLVEAQGRVVSKDELLDRVWNGVIVEENNLSVHVSQLRKLCGSKALSTVPGRGYQLTAISISPDSRIEEHDISQPSYNSEAKAETSASHRGNLPTCLPILIGRHAELLEVKQILNSNRLVTITGAGGMGKTRLAEAIGKEFSAQLPVWIIEFATLSDPKMVPSVVAQVLGATIVDTEHPLDAIISAISGQAALIILDNCEHLVSAVSALCGSLLIELPLLRILVTSQELLRDPEEVVYKLGPLEFPRIEDTEHSLQSGAIQLLASRIRALARDFEITPDNVEDALVICKQLDGLPLAIELAAGRVPLLGLAGVRSRLGELFRLLTAESRVRLRRHQALRAALDWSYQLLETKEQALFRLLGVFSGSFSVEGVRQIASDLHVDEWGALDTLGSLIDKSMVHVKGVDHPRYMMLETTRAYALEQMAKNGETEHALARHAQSTLNVCAMARRRRDTKAIWSEIANIRAAYSWAMRNNEIELAVALVNDSSVVLALNGLVGEVVQRLVEVEPLVTDDLPPPLLAQYWQWLGRFGHDGRLHVDRCINALQKAEVLYRGLGNIRHVHACLRMQAESLVEQGNLKAAQDAIDAARELENHQCPLADGMRRLRLEARILEARNEFAQAIIKYEEALAIASLSDIHRYIVTISQDIGRCLLHDDPAAAEKRFLAVIADDSSDLSTAVAVAYARGGLILSLLAQQRISSARLAALDAIPLLRSCGMLLAHAEAYAWLFAEMGYTHAAILLLHTSDEFRSNSGTSRGHVHCMAYQSAASLLPERNHSDMAVDPILSNFELAQILTCALTG